MPAQSSPGGQSFCLGGYYSECRLDTESGQWKIVTEPPASEKTRLRVGQEDGGEQTEPPASEKTRIGVGQEDGGEEGEGGSQPVAAGGGSRSAKAMKKACACRACRSVSTWSPGSGLSDKPANLIATSILREDESDDLRSVFE